MSLPQKTKYPQKLDTDFELKTVHDSLISKIVSNIVPFDSNDNETFNWGKGQGIIDIENSDEWPSSGFVTIYLPDKWGKAKERSIIFHYSNKNKTSLINVNILSGQILIFFPIGSVAVQNVVAQNHNFNKDSIIALETYLGYRGTQDQASIEWFTDFYVKNIRIPKPWLTISSSSLVVSGDLQNKSSKIVQIFVDDYIEIEDQTTRINPGFEDSQDKTVKWFFELGDQTRVNVSLDSDTLEYFFEIIKKNDLGKTITETTKKKNWNKKIFHKYKEQGIYTVSLTVINEFGSDRVDFFDFIKVMDDAPSDLSLSISSSNGFSTVINFDNVNNLELNNQVRSLGVRDQISIASKVGKLSNIEIEKWEWDFGPNVDKDTIMNSPVLNLNFSTGGFYDVGLKVITKFGTYAGIFLNNVIDIVEKPSVWLGYNTKTSSDFHMNEYSILSKSWKSHPNILNLKYNFSFSNSFEGDQLSFTSDKGFHSPPNSNDAYILWSSDKLMSEAAKYDSIKNTSFSLNSGAKIHNWYTLYMPVFNNNRIYMLGGFIDINNINRLSQEIVFYDISKNTYNTINVKTVTHIIDDPFCIKDELQNGEECPKITVTQSVPFNDSKKLLFNSQKDKIITWKTASLLGKGYIFRNSSSGFIDELHSFDPDLVIFKEYSTILPFSKTEFSVSALNNGIYVISNAGDINKFDPITNVWTTTTNASTINYTGLFYGSDIKSRDPNAKVISGSESRSINASNNSLYFSYDYGLDSFGKFDTINLSFSKLTSRPSYPDESNSKDQWGLTVF